MVEHKLVSFASIVRLCRLLQRFTTSAVEKHTRQKLCHFCRYVGIAKLFCQKMFCPGHPGWRDRMEKFSSPIQIWDLVRKARDFGNRGSPAFHLKKSIFLLNKRATRRDFGNRASSGWIKNCRTTATNSGWPGSYEEALFFEACESESGREDAIKVRLE